MADNATEQPIEATAAEHSRPRSDTTDYAAYIRSHVRTVSNWPIAGVEFRDITPLLSEPASLRLIVEAFVDRYRGLEVDYFAGLEARGFILAPLLAYELGAGFIPIRKKGKLPFSTLSETYQLEYGEATVEVHTDACKAGDRVVLVDDLIATGGTLLAGRRCATSVMASCVGISEGPTTPRMRTSVSRSGYNP